jgi:hypothetical protein
LLDQRPYTFLPVNGLEERSTGGSHRNFAEAKTVVDLVCKLRSMKASQDPSWFSMDRIRIITLPSTSPSDQKLVNQRELGEADVVLVFFVRSPPSDKTSLSKLDAVFLADDRRMNVALTRAKYQLICIGNVQAMKHMVGAKPFELLAEDAEKRGVIEPYLTS